MRRASTGTKPLHFTATKCNPLDYTVTELVISKIQPSPNSISRSALWAFLTNTRFTVVATKFTPPPSTEQNSPKENTSTGTSDKTTTLDKKSINLKVICRQNDFVLFCAALLEVVRCYRHRGPPVWCDSTLHSLRSHRRSGEYLRHPSRSSRSTAVK